MKRVIVMGAGILGASSAYHLTKLGYAVTVVDNGALGQATEAAAGIVCPWLTQRRNQAWYELVKAGAKYYPMLIKELEGLGETDTGYAQVGAISIHHDEMKLSKIEERAYLRRQQAPELGEIKRLTSKETSRLFPLVSELYSSVHISGAARVNGKALRDALIRASQKCGATFLHSEATLIKEEQHVLGIKLSNGQLVESEEIIVTAGAWARTLLAEIGIPFSVRPQKAQIIHVNFPKYNTNEWPVVMPPGNQYIVPFSGGRIVIGATHEDEAGFDTTPTIGGIHEIINKALEYAPGLRSGTYLETKVGFRPFTPGFLPVMGGVPHLKNVWIANGLGASGLTAGPLLGWELAKLIKGEPTILDPIQYDITEALN